MVITGPGVKPFWHAAFVFSRFLCVYNRTADFVGLVLEAKEQIALVQEALSKLSSFSFWWFGTVSVGIVNSLLEEIKLIILGRLWEAARWETWQEHQALQGIYTGCTSNLLEQTCGRVMQSDDKHWNPCYYPEVPEDINFL